MELPFVQEEGIRILFTSDAIYLVFAERIVEKVTKTLRKKNFSLWVAKKTFHAAYTNTSKNLRLVI